jgi:hypothetical protein
VSKKHNAVQAPHGKPIRREGSPARPSPVLAAGLSAVLPGLGQLYLGKFLTGILFGAAWLVSFFGMLDVIYHLERDPHRLLYALGALALGGSSWIASVLLARYAAGVMTRHAGIYRWAGERCRRHEGKMPWPALALSLFFAVTAFGEMRRSPLAGRVADYVKYSMGYETVGIFFLLMFSAFLAVLSQWKDSLRSRVTSLAVVYAGFTLFVNLTFHVSLRYLLVSALILLPGYVSALLHPDAVRKETLMRQGAIGLIALVGSIFITGFVGSILELAVSPVERHHFINLFTMILWGAVYFGLKAALTILHAVYGERESR